MIFHSSPAKGGELTLISNNTSLDENDFTTERFQQGGYNLLYQTTDTSLFDKIFTQLSQSKSNVLTTFDKSNEIAKSSIIRFGITTYDAVNTQQRIDNGLQDNLLIINVNE